MTIAHSDPGSASPSPRPSLSLGSLAALLLALLTACGDDSSNREAAAREAEPGQPRPAANVDREEPDPLRRAYFGDLHIHTRYSHDAFLGGLRADPDDAYRYCRGGELEHPTGELVRLAGPPLDFCAVTDHAMHLGVFSAMADPGDPLSEQPAAAQLLDARTVTERKSTFPRAASLLGEVPPEERERVGRSTWERVVEAAHRHYEPGVFTTFAGYEYTSAPESQNLHRNVLFRGERVPELPFSRYDSPNPEKLWAWLDALRSEGIEALAIPHNSNGSNGQMFRLESFDGSPLDRTLAETRLRNEPLVEVTQIKGSSETHPLLSPNDEWASFEIYDRRIATNIASEVSGSYVREAYRNGLLLEQTLGVDPFRFGLVGSSDTHNAAASLEESDYFGKIGVIDGGPRRRGAVPLDGPREPTPLERTYVDERGRKYVDDVGLSRFGASGLAGVWAEANTRESIYDALRRKETFATSGPRIRLRFFAGTNYPPRLASDPEMIQKAYAGGVPMGSELQLGTDDTPRFLVWALRDPASAPLQRLQIVKGWVADGTSHERVFDVACSDGLLPDSTTWRCPDNGAAVDLTDCSISAERGAAELAALWSDPDYAAGQRAFYYLRALENPTCRWSTWDALRAGVEPRSDLPATLQERAWSSPVWLLPGSD